MNKYIILLSPPRLRNTDLETHTGMFTWFQKAVDISGSTRCDGADEGTQILLPRVLSTYNLKTCSTTYKQTTNTLKIKLKTQTVILHTLLSAVKHEFLNILVF